MAKEDIVLEKATDTDISEYISIGREVQSNMFSTFTDSKALAEHIEKNGNPYIIKNRGKAIGFISCENKDHREVYLSNFAINPQFQGQGIGRMVLQKVLADVADAPKVWLVTHPENSKAIRLYESLGFTITDKKENYFGDGEPRIVMTLYRH